MKIKTRAKLPWQYTRVDILGEWKIFQHTFSRNFKIHCIRVFEARSSLFLKGMLFNQFNESTWYWEKKQGPLSINSRKLYYVGTMGIFKLRFSFAHVYFQAMCYTEPSEIPTWLSSVWAEPYCQSPMTYVHCTCTPKLMWCKKLTGRVSFIISYLTIILFQYQDVRCCNNLHLYFNIFSLRLRFSQVIDFCTKTYLIFSFNTEHYMNWVLYLLFNLVRFFSTDSIHGRV